MIKTMPEYILSENSQLYKIVSDVPLTLEELKSEIVQLASKQARQIEINEEQFQVLSDYSQSKGIEIEDAIIEMFLDLEEKINR